MSTWRLSAGYADNGWQAWTGKLMSHLCQVVWYIPSQYAPGRKYRAIFSEKAKLNTFPVCGQPATHGRGRAARCVSVLSTQTAGFPVTVAQSAQLRRDSLHPSPKMSFCVPTRLLRVLFPSRTFTQLHPPWFFLPLEVQNCSVTVIKYKNLTSFMKHVKPMTPIKPQYLFASVIGVFIISKAYYTNKKIFAVS